MHWIKVEPRYVEAQGPPLFTEVSLVRIDPRDSKLPQDNQRVSSSVFQRSPIIIVHSWIRQIHKPMVKKFSRVVSCTSVCWIQRGLQSRTKGTNDITYPWSYRVEPSIASGSNRSSIAFLCFPRSRVPRFRCPSCPSALSALSSSGSRREPAIGKSRNRIFEISRFS